MSFFDNLFKKYPPFKLAFTPFKDGAFEMPNRFMRSATWLSLANGLGEATSELINRYTELALGGVGFIWVEFTSVSPEGIPLPNLLTLHTPSQADSLGRLVRAIKRAGGRVGIQLAHAGALSNHEYNGHRRIFAPSHIVDLKTNVVKAEALTTPEIMRILSDFTRAAMTAKELEFDAVQLHLAHGFLFNQFLSPLYNKRNDQYGGSIENRSFIVKQAIELLRNAVGQDYPIWVKINCSDFNPNGMTEKDGMYVAAHLRQWGVSGVEVSGGSGDVGKLGPSRSVDTPEQEAYFLRQALEIKKLAHMPVALVGGLRSSGVIEGALDKGIDIVSLSRPLIREPNLIKRWQEGRLAPSTCWSCNECFKLGMKDTTNCIIYSEGG